VKNNKDRIICVSKVTSSEEQQKNKLKDSCYKNISIRGYHTFYYQPVNSTERFYLFSTKRYSRSIAAAFAERGMLVSDRQSIQTHSITLKEFYHLKACHQSYVLNKICDRIPVWINDVIRNELADSEVFIPVRRKEVRLSHIGYKEKKCCA